MRSSDRRRSTCRKKLKTQVEQSLKDNYAIKSFIARLAEIAATTIKNVAQWLVWVAKGSYTLSIAALIPFILLRETGMVS